MGSGKDQLQRRSLEGNARLASSIAHGYHQVGDDQTSSHPLGMVALRSIWCRLATFSRLAGRHVFRRLGSGTLGGFSAEGCP